ncbi:MAG: hypothetical protein WD423_04255 [Rhodothermales bacterium]
MLSCLLVLGCSDTLAPPENLEQPFSMYGALSPQRDTQSVRIYPIQEFLVQPDADDIEDIRVTSTNLQTGVARTWQDTVVVGLNGEPEFIFWSVFEATYGTVYRIEAERTSDGARSFAEVRVPELVDIVVENPRIQGVEIAIRGEGIRVLKPLVEYFVGVPGSGYLNRRYAFSYQGREQKTDEGWMVEIDFADERITVQSFYNIDTPPLQSGSDCAAITLLELSLEVLVGNSSWDPPGGIFDPNLLIRQGAMSNVENGFGFIGAGYRTSSDVTPPSDIVEAACFAVPAHP